MQTPLDSGRSECTIFVSVSSKRKRKRRIPPPDYCALCGGQLDEGGVCTACGAVRIKLSPELGEGLVRLYGPICSVLEEPVGTGGESSTDGWRPSFEMEPCPGLQVQVATNAETEILQDPSSTREPGTAVAVLGESQTLFAEQLEGLREPAHAIHLLRARVIAMGPAGVARLDLAIRRLQQKPKPRQPEGESSSAQEPSPPWDGRLPDDLYVKVKEHRPGEPWVRISVGKRWFPGLLALPWLLVMVGTLGGLITWQIWAVFSDSPYGYLAAGLTVLALIAVILGGLMAFRRTTIRVDQDSLSVVHWPLPHLLPRRWSAPASQVAELVTEDLVLKARLADGTWHDLLPDADLEQRDFVRRTVAWMAELPEEAAPEEPLAVEEQSNTGARRNRWLASTPIGALASLLKYTAYLLPVLLFATLMWVPFCPLTVGHRVWKEAQRISEGCHEVTALLGRDITWAVGWSSSEDMDSGYISLKVKGDQRRGEMDIEWKHLADGGVRISRLDVEVGNKKVCALCCKVYGVAPKHRR